MRNWKIYSSLPLSDQLTSLVEILSRRRRNSGKKLWFTGRRFYQLRIEEFDRVKHILPTHLVQADHRMYVNFDGSQQRCFNCLNEGHLIANCPDLQTESFSTSVLDAAGTVGAPTGASTPHARSRKSNRL